MEQSQINTFHNQDEELIEQWENELDLLGVEADEEELLTMLLIAPDGAPSRDCLASHLESLKNHEEQHQDD